MSDLLQVAIAGVAIGLIYALLAGGLTLIFGVFEVLNVAHGELLVAGALITYYLWDATGIHPLLTLPASAVLLFAVGMFLQWALIERVLRHGIIVSLIMLFGVGLALVGLGVQFLGVNARSVPYYSGALSFGSVAVSMSRIVVVAVAVPILVAMSLYLSRSRLGIATKATAQNAQIAEACGIDVRRIRMVTMGLASAMAGVAGSLLILVFPLDVQSGLNYVIIAFVVAVVGGLGNYAGSVVAGLLLGVAGGVVTLYANAQLSVAAAFLLLVVMLVVRPAGLLSGRAQLRGAR